MPDRAGRFSIDDGLNIARTVLSIQDNQLKQDERRKNLERRDKIESNLKMYAQGQKPDPMAPDYDAVADLEAQAVWGRNALQDEQLKVARYDTDIKAAQVRKPKIDQYYGDTLNAYRQYEAEQDPEKKKAMANKVIESAMPIYDFVPNGMKYVGRDDKAGVLKFKNLAGQELTEPIPDPKAVVEKAYQFAQGYGDYYHGAREKMREFNAKQLLAPVREKAKDGTEALHFTMLDMDPTTGDYVPRETWKDPKTLKVLKGFDEATGKEIEGPDFKPTDQQKKEADIAHTEASTRKLKAEASGKDGAKEHAETTSKTVKAAKDKLAYELQPFAGSKPVYDENDVLTKEGKTALDEAIHLVAKYRRKENLSDAEKIKIKHAINAVNMFEQDSALFTEEYKAKPKAADSDYVKNLIKNAKSGK